MRSDENTDRLFQPVESGNVPWNSWTISLASHIAIVAFIAALPAAVVRPVFDAHRAASPVVLSLFVRPRTLAPLKPALRVPPPPQVRQEPFHPKPFPVAATAPRPPEPEVVRNILPVIDAPAISQPLPAQPALDLTLPAARPVIVGGFGNPAGAQPSSVPAERSAPRLGGFDLPSGGGRGHGGVTAVARSGFDDGRGPSPSNSTSKDRETQASGFDGLRTAAAAPSRLAAIGPVETPVEITFKPRPVYTAEGREKHIEGEVLLEVNFLAIGQVSVLRVVRGLGYGLDEAAADAARRIRFNPAMRRGTPVDMQGAVHITFKLS